MREDSNDIEDLPPEIRNQFFEFVRVENGQAHVVDREGFVVFILKHVEKYPVLGTILAVDEAALITHFEETGEVPPGVKLIGKTRVSDNVTKVEILHGPIPPRPKA